MATLDWATLICDVGGVIVQRNPAAPQRWLDDPDHYLQAEYTPGIVDTLRVLTEAVGASNAWLLSKCSPATEARTREFLQQRGFYTGTGISPEQVRFCRERIGPGGKTPLILNELWDQAGPLLLIDDRSQILVDVHTAARKCGIYTGWIRLFAFATPADELNRYAPDRNDLIVIDTAAQLLTEAQAVLR